MLKTMIWIIIALLALFFLYRDVFKRKRGEEAEG